MPPEKERIEGVCNLLTLLRVWHTEMKFGLPLESSYGCPNELTLPFPFKASQEQGQRLLRRKGLRACADDLAWQALISAGKGCRPE